MSEATALYTRDQQGRAVTRLSTQSLVGTTFLLWHCEPASCSRGMLVCEMLTRDIGQPVYLFTTKNAVKEFAMSEQRKRIEDYTCRKMMKSG